MRLIVATFMIGLIVAGSATAADLTLDQFKQYAASRLQGVDAARLTRLAAMVDKNSDGKISQAEFADRMSAVQKILRPDTPEPTPPKPVKPAEPQSIVAVETNHAGDATILLITSDKLAKTWQRYADWKTQNGKATRIATVGQIEKRYKAASIQEKIRLCVRDHVENRGTRWVVLGGDCLSDGGGVVPGGHTTVHAQERAGIPTDIVFLSPTDWDADDDGIYGEWTDDRAAITYPDGSIGLGRIPVRTADDVAAFTDKVIAYESRYPTSDFATQMIYTCTEKHAYPKVRKSWDGYVSKVWGDGQVGRYFSAETPWDKKDEPGSHPLSAENLVALINGGTIGKLHIHGHGFLSMWMLEGSRFTGKHVGQLKNEVAYPLITTVSCYTGQYDAAQDPSIVEAMLRQPRGGSVAIVAPVRTGKPHFHQRSDFRLMMTEGKLDGTTQTMTRYWSGGLGDGLTTGQSLMKAKADMVPDARRTAGYHLCICELNLLGDPTLDMRAAVPRTPKLALPERIGTGSQTIEIRTDAPKCTVCLWKGKDLYQVATADDEGTVELQIDPKTKGDMLVTATGKNLNSVTKTVSVQ